MILSQNYDFVFINVINNDADMLSEIGSFIGAKAVSYETLSFVNKHLY